MSGVALLDVSTDEAGIEPGDTLQYLITAEDVSDGSSRVILRDVPNYVDSSIITLMINDLLPGANYLFNVRTRNNFGTSEVSETVTLRIQTQSPDTPNSTRTGITVYQANI